MAVLNTLEFLLWVLNKDFIIRLSNLVINKEENKLTEQLFPPKIQCPNQFKKCPCLIHE